MSTGRIVLFQVAKEIEAFLEESLSDEKIVFDKISNAEQLLAGLRQSSQPTDALVLGLAAKEPISIAQRVHSFSHDISVLILSEPNRCAQLDQAMQFSPFLGTEVKSWSLELTEGLPLALKEIVGRIHKRRRYQGTIMAAQRRIKNMNHQPPRLSHYLERLVDRAPVGILNVDANRKILNLNRLACRVLNVSERDVVGLTIESLFPESERDRLKNLMARCVAPLRRKDRPEVLALASTGDRRTAVEITAASMIDRAGQLGCTIILQDVTDRQWAEQERQRVEEDLKKSESQLRIITDALPILISYIDAQHKYCFNNKAYEFWFGLSRSELAGRHVREVIGESAYEVLKPNIDQALLGEPVDFETRLPYKGRGSRFVRGHMMPDFMKDGDVRGVVTVVSDVTESKLAEDREKLHLKELAHVSRVATIGEMSSQIAHELAQPLTAIANFTEASLRLLDTSSATREDLVESLTDIAAMTDRARDVISQLRSFMRKNELQQLPEDVNNLVQDVLKIERAETRWRELDLELELDRSLPRVMADKTLIEQVILNLVHNAVESVSSASSASKCLKIQTRKVRNNVQVAVSDSGPGFPDDTVNKIFEPFFTTKNSGLGMGLTISRSIVDAHGGRLWAERNHPTGAIFRFTLEPHV